MTLFTIAQAKSLRIASRLAGESVLDEQSLCAQEKHMKTLHLISLMHKYSILISTNMFPVLHLFVFIKVAILNCIFPRWN